MKRDGDNGFCKSIVEFGGDLSDGTLAREIVKNRVDKRGPVEAECGMPNVKSGGGNGSSGRNGERVGRDQKEGIGFFCCRVFEGEFEFHGGLAFETDQLTETDEAGDGVEKTADARGQRGI